MGSGVHEVLAAAVGSIGGAEREGQTTMAVAVKQAFDEERHLLVQAGTGTGKSLGYLVPAALHHQRVVISTATLALQRQLVARDIPAVSAALSATGAGPASWAIVKGRSNYACLYRVRDGMAEEQESLIEMPTGELGAQVLALREWAEDQAAAAGSGDRDHAEAHSDVAWRQVSVSARDCIGASRCPFGEECFAERAREEAGKAQLVVTNHAMLAIDAIDGVPMLPEYQTVVIDEAHELTARVTQAATAELDPGMIERAVRRARPHLEAGRAAEDLSDAADSLAEALTGMDPGRILPAHQHVFAALAFVRDAARACFSAFVKKSEPDPAAHQARSAVEDIRAIADRMAEFAERDVLWLDQGRSQLGLRIAPIDVADTLGERLFQEKTTVLTSATLALGGSFDPLARAVGLGSADDTWTGLDVGSPFSYPQQGILYAAEHLPTPGRDGPSPEQLAEIVSLIRAAGGRTLGLFSSRRAADSAAAYVREHLPQTSLECQGDAQLPELLRRFAENPQACLFGTLSLWQGVDVPGATCSLVIIDRIPFPRPDDPVTTARQQRIAKHGGNGFMQVAAQHAALWLAQGVGRLIRSPHDRGVVAILDPRIVTAPYGGFLSSSLPQMWRTTDTEVVLDALRSLDSSAREHEDAVL